MSSDDEKVPGPEATPEEKRVIVAHDCALEILELPVEDRGGVVDAIASLVLPPAPAPLNPMFDLLIEIAKTLSVEQQTSLVRLMNPEQLTKLRAGFKAVVGVDLPEL